MIPLRDDNPTTIKPVVTVVIITLATAVFLWQISFSPSGGERAVYALGVIPAVLLGDRSLPSELVAVPPAMTLITSMFLQGGWLHARMLGDGGRYIAAWRAGSQRA